MLSLWSPFTPSLSDRAANNAEGYLATTISASTSASGTSIAGGSLALPSPTGLAGAAPPARPPLDGAADAVQPSRRPTRTHWLSMQVEDDGAKMATLGLILALPVTKTEGCTVKRILPGNRAWLSCSIKLGDEIISVGGFSARGMAVTDVAKLLDRATAEAVLATKKLRVVVRRAVPDCDADADDAGARLGRHRW